MKHLVIGSGNMGKRHGAILEALGDEVSYADLEFDVHDSADRRTILESDSVLICTPPETHCELIGWLCEAGVPLFVEKPVMTSDHDSFFVPRELISMVACNWRWCKCLMWREHTTVLSMYHGAVPLDYIHFVDLFWHEIGAPEYARRLARKGDTQLGLFLAHKQREAEIYVNPLPDKRMEPIMIVNHEDIHKDGPCDMFERQMRHWRSCVRDGKQSCNPIPMAVERTAWLIKILNG